MLSIVRITCLLLVFIARLSAQTLRFEEALQRTLDCAPELQITAAEAQERRGDWRQSKLYPNPEFGLNVNDVADDRVLAFGNTTYEITQTFEWIGKRSAKQKAARYDYYAACLWCERERISVLNRLIRAFVTAMAAQEELALAKNRKEIAESVLKAVKDVSEAGKGSGIQYNKAEVELALADVDLQKALLDYFIAKEALVLSWGASCPDFDDLAYPFYDVQIPKALDACAADLCGHPEYKALYCRYQAARKHVCYEQASRIPDVSLTLGYERTRDPDDSNVTVGLTVPIPVWDRNQGNI